MADIVMSNFLPDPFEDCYPAFEVLVDPEFYGAITPEKFDIVCGRDKFAQRHEGNKRFRVIIDINRVRYQNAPSRDLKTKITHEIVEMIRSDRPGGRFLKLNVETNSWYEVGNEYAHEKVSHALRSAKDPNRKKTPKKRKTVAKKPKIDYSNGTFAALLQKQRLIFQQLLAEDGSGAEWTTTPDDDESTSIVSV